MMTIEELRRFVDDEQMATAHLSKSSVRNILSIIDGKSNHPSPYQPVQNSVETAIKETNPYAMVCEQGVDGDYIHQEEVVSLMQKYANAALTAQAQAHEEELEAFAVFAQDTVKELFRLMIEAAPDRNISDIVLTINPAAELIEAFRASRSGNPVEEEHKCGTCGQDISPWGFCPGCDTQMNSR